MKQSVITLTQQVVKEYDVDLNSPYKLERKFLYNKVVEEMDFTGYNKERMERKLRVINKVVNMMFG